MADQPADEWWKRWRARRGPYRFTAARRAELQYARALRRIADAVDGIVKGFVPPGTDEIPQEAADRIADALNRYAMLIHPWAEAVGKRMIADVAARDRAAWFGLAREMGVAIREEIATAPTGEALRSALAQQVGLITSLPYEAAQRVHQITTEALPSGRRAASIAAEILRTGEVTKSRAELIARTEVGRTALEFTKARAQAIGSEGYIWTSAHDRLVRPRHKKLNGQFIRWDAPPIASEPGQKVMRYHAGAGPRCRCVPHVVIPQHFFGQSAAA